MSARNERACVECGSFLHHEDFCAARIQRLSAAGGQRQLNPEGGHHAAGVMPRPVTTHNAGSAAVDVQGAAGRAVEVDLALAAALAAYKERYSDAALKDFLRGYLGCVLY